MFITVRGKKLSAEKASVSPWQIITKLRPVKQILLKVTAEHLISDLKKIKGSL